jgi:hypothetical protein
MNSMLSRRLAGLVLLATVFASCASTPEHHAPLTPEHRAADEQAVVAALDAFHDAAARADAEQYFGWLAEDAIFYGTDPDERWTREELRVFADPYFSTGRGWSYETLTRNVFFDDSHRIAWFDETLRNVKYDDVRGTGVLRREGAGWLLVQYNLSFPVPNELVPELVKMIRGSVARDGG